MTPRGVRDSLPGVFRVAVHPSHSARSLRRGGPSEFRMKMDCLPCRQDRLASLSKRARLPAGRLRRASQRLGKKSLAKVQKTFIREVPRKDYHEDFFLLLSQLQPLTYHPRIRFRLTYTFHTRKKMNVPRASPLQREYSFPLVVSFG